MLLLLALSASDPREERPQKRGFEIQEHEKKRIKTFVTLISLKMFGRMILGRGLLISLIATRSPVARVLSRGLRSRKE